MNDRLPSNGDAPEHAERNLWLWNAFARSVRDNMVAEFVVQGLRVGGMVVLARALSPNDFGLFKILVVVSTFAMLVNEAGIPDALIQRRDLTPAHHATAWWMSIGLALLTCGTALRRRARTRACDEDAGSAAGHAPAMHSFSARGRSRHRQCATAARLALRRARGRRRSGGVRVSRGRASAAVVPDADLEPRGRPRGALCRACDHDPVCRRKNSARTSHFGRGARPGPICHQGSRRTNRRCAFVQH